MKKKVCFVVGIIWGIISIFLIIATLTGQMNIYGIDGWIFWIAIIMLPAISSALLIYIDNAPHIHHHKDALTDEDIQEIYPDKNSFPRHMKIFATVIIVIVVAATIGGFKAYDQGHLDGYSVGYDEGYEIGYDEGYDIGYDEGYSEAEYDNGENDLGTSNNYLTTDTAPAGTVWVTPHGEKYHESWCQYISGRYDLTYFNDADEAMSAGYSPCSVCH